MRSPMRRMEGVAPQSLAAASSSANGAADPSSLNLADTALVDQDGCPRTNGGVGREAFGRVLLAETPMIVEAGLRVYDVLRTHSDGRVLPKVPWRSWLPPSPLHYVAPLLSAYN